MPMSRFALWIFCVAVTASGAGAAFGQDYPVKAAFDIGTVIRWVDFNDYWYAAESGHLSDNLGAILAVADYVSRGVRHALFALSGEMGYPAVLSASKSGFCDALLGDKMVVTEDKSFTRGYKGPNRWLPAGMTCMRTIEVE